MTADQEVRDLVVRAQGGDREAYDILYRRFRAKAFAYAYAVLGDCDLAEDARQEAFVDAYCDLLSLKEPAAFPGWFRTIVLRHSIRIRRSQKGLLVPLEGAVDCASGAPGTEETVRRKETQEIIRRAVSKLPPPEREVVVLLYLEEIPLREIPIRVGAPLSTVKNRLHAARNRLRTELMKLVKDTVQKQRRAGSKEAVHAASLEALSVFDEELRSLLGPPGDEQCDRICELFCAKGRLLRFMGQNDQALACFRKGLAAPALRRKPLLRARLSTEIGLTYLNTSHYEKARAALSATRKTLPDPSKNSALMAAVLNGLGTCAWGTGDYHGARHFFEETIKNARAASCLELETEALQNLALLDWRDGRLVEALGKLRRCLRQWKGLDSRFEWVLTLMNSGVLEENLGRTAVARRHYEEALAVAENLNYLQVQTATLANLASLSLGAKRWRKAEEYSGRAVEIAKKIRDRRSETIALENLALAHIGLRRHIEAARVLRQARGIAAAIGDRERLLSLQLTEIEMLLGRGRYSGPRERLANAARMLREHGYVAELPRLLRLRALAQSIKGDEIAARKTLVEAFDACRQQKNRPEERRVQELEKKWARKKKPGILPAR